MHGHFKEFTYEEWFLRKPNPSSICDIHGELDQMKSKEPRSFIL